MVGAMSDLQNEPLAALVRELREERIAEKAERDAQAQRERWTRYTSITIVVVAVLTAVASLWVGKFSTRTLAALNDATFHQVKASDTWSLYQAKSIKQNLYEVTRDQTQALGAGDARAAAILATMNGKLAQYEQDRRTIRADSWARPGLEQRRRLHQFRRPCRRTAVPGLRLANPA